MRLPAEWERQKALLITYPHENSDWAAYLDEVEEFYDEFIAIVSHYQDLIILTQKELAIKPAKYTIKTINVPTNDTWIRDYGPISVQDEKGRFHLLDFTFNGWGLKYSANYDNLVNRRVFQTTKLGFVLEGGSIDSNGEGTLLTTSKCLLEPNRNPHLNKSQIESFFKQTFSLQKILWLDFGYLEGDDTDSHIDMLARFTAPDTIAYIACDERDEHYEELKKMERQIRSFGYKTVPLPWVGAKYYDNERLPASYANFVIINGAVIVPIYQDSNDDEALKIMKKLFPDRDIIALDASILLRQHGSIHCSCMNLF